MLKLIKKLLGQSAVYGLGAMVMSLCTVVLAPIYLRRMNLGEYGKVEMLNSFSSVLTTALTLGIVTVLPKIYVHDCKDEPERKRVLSSVLTVSVIGAAFLFSFCWVFSGWLALMLCNGRQYGNLVMLAAASSGCLLIQQIAIIYLRVEQWPGKYVAVSITQAFVTLAVNIYLVWFRRLGIYGVELSSVYGGLASLTLTLILVKPGLTSRISFNAVKHVLRLSIPVMPAILVPWVLNVSDRYFLKYSHGLFDTGLYSVGYKIGMMALLLFINAFQLAWSPFFQINSDGSDAKQLCAKTAKYYMMVLMLMAVMVSVFTPEIIRLLSKREYWTEANFRTCTLIVPFIALSYVLNGMQTFTIPLFIRKNRGKLLSIVMGSTALLNLTLNAVLIPRFGIWGAVSATLASFAAGCIACQTISGMLYRTPFEYWNYAKLVAVSAVVYLLFSRLQGISVEGVFLKLLLPIVYGSLLLAGKFVDTHEMQLVQGIPVRVMRRLGLNAYRPT